MGTHDDFDDFDDRLLDQAAAQVPGLFELPPDELLDRLHTLVRQALTARRPDGTWPPAELLAEVLRSYLDVLDTSGAAATGGPPPPWIAAWREAADSPALLERLLAELRDFDDTAGIPTYDPPPELHIVDP
jgi:hypothetical protein